MAFNRYDVMDLPEPRVAREGVDLRKLVWATAGLLAGLIVYAAFLS